MKPQGVYTVTIQKKDQVVKRVLNEDSFAVGRSIDCLVQLNDSSISRVHVEVVRRDDQVWIEDKNSSNGTFINGTKIAGGTAINVIPNDKIQIGKSDYILSIELIVEEEKSPESILKAVAAAGEDDASRTHEMRPESIRMPMPEVHHSESDAVHEARKKAAQVIYEGEIQAEKKVQAIYKKAQEAQAEAESQSKKKIADARKEAETLIEQSQTQGQELLREARSFAQQIRDEVHAYVDGLRVKAQEEADSVLFEAKKKSEQLRAELVAESREQVEKESANLIRKSKEEAADILREAEEDAQKFYKDIEDHKTEIIELQKKLAEAQVSARDAEESTRSLRDQESKAKSELSEFESKAKAEISQLEASIAENTKEAGMLTDEVKIKQKKVEELKGLIANRTMELKAVEDNKAQFDKELELKRQQIKERLEKEEHNFVKASEERLNEMNNDLKKRVEKMEMDLLTELMHKREMLQKEVFNQVEKVCRPRMDASDWSQTISDVQKAIHAAFESKLVDISQSSIPVDGKVTDLSKKRRNDKWRWAYSGVAAGVALLFGVQTGYKVVVEDQNPLRTRTLAEAQKRQEDLARRKFNPPQVLEPKDTYVDSVIYTKSYAKNYLNPEFQKKLYKAASSYLLKTWRLEEEKSIEVLAAAGALVQELEVKKETIHPDFVKDGIAKMRKIEAQTTQRMKDILGTEVRLESYRAFEKKFYAQEAPNTP